MNIIDTAPRDGTHILAADLNSHEPLWTAVHWFQDGWYLSVNAMEEYAAHGCGSLTHWLPMPATREMNEIALANFYRVLNQPDRFPREKQLADAAIGATIELNTLKDRRAPAVQATADADELAREIWAAHRSPDGAGRPPTVSEIGAIIRKAVSPKAAQEEQT